jgi:hypothetical protein
MFHYKMLKQITPWALFVLEETDREFCSYPYQEAGAEAVMI